MDNPILWLVWLLGLSILSLVQALVLVLRLSQGRTRKKSDQKPENPNHGERIATLEEAVENIKEDITEIKEKLP